MRSTIDEQDAEPSIEPTSNTDAVSRRLALGLIGLGGVGLLGAGTAAARAGGRPWRTDVDARGNSLLDLGALAMRTNPVGITNFAGDNLEIDAEGVLNAELLGVRDDDAPLVHNVSTVTFGANLSVTDGGGGAVTVDAGGSSVGDGSVGGGTSVHLDDAQNISGGSSLRSSSSTPSTSTN